MSKVNIYLLTLCVELGIYLFAHFMCRIKFENIFYLHFNWFLVVTDLFDGIFRMVVVNQIRNTENIEFISCFTKKFKGFLIFMFVLGEANIYLKKRWTRPLLGWQACLTRWRTTVLFSRAQSHIRRTRRKFWVMKCKKGVCCLKGFEKEQREQDYWPGGYKEFSSILADH